MYCIGEDNSGYKYCTFNSECILIDILENALCSVYNYLGWTLYWSQLSLFSSPFINRRHWAQLRDMLNVTSDVTLAEQMLSASPQDRTSMLQNLLFKQHGDALSPVLKDIFPNASEPPVTDACTKPVGQQKANETGQKKGRKLAQKWQRYKATTCFLLPILPYNPSRLILSIMTSPLLAIPGPNLWRLILSIMVIPVPQVVMANPVYNSQSSPGYSCQVFFSMLWIVMTVAQSVMYVLAILLGLIVTACPFALCLLIFPHTLSKAIQHSIFL